MLDKWRAIFQKEVIVYDTPIILWTLHLGIVTLGFIKDIEYYAITLSVRSKLKLEINYYI